MSTRTHQRAAGRDDEVFLGRAERQKAARLYGDYLKVRQYIENIASQIHMIQLTEHSVYDLHEYVVTMPAASSTRRRSRRQSEVADHFAQNDSCSGGVHWSGRADIN
jgi:hypothetical protein